MRIRKKFSFEGSHIVRNCSSERCKYSIHGHSYVLEIFLTADRLDNGHMIYDFGLLKGFIKDFIDNFDHSTMFWDQDDPEYIDFIKTHSLRWVSLPVSSSAEALALVFLKAFNFILDQTEFSNGEGDVRVSSVIVHETATGYAESVLEDLSNANMPRVDLEKIEFSPHLQTEWQGLEQWRGMLRGDVRIQNPTVEIQIQTAR
jgi:6-pyruvoyltetrahydropterin/6-carboxytetrahydropterin synthase